MADRRLREQNPAVTRCVLLAGLLVIAGTIPSQAHDSKGLFGFEDTLNTDQQPDYSEATTRVQINNFTDRTLRVFCEVRMTSYWSRCCDNGYEETSFEASRDVGFGRLRPFGEKERTVTLTANHPGITAQGWEPSFVSVDLPHCHARKT